MRRGDGRKHDELRKINIQRDFIKYAEGSCLIGLGNTKVICTASVDRTVPLFLRNSGEGWITAEYRMLPRATHTRVFRDKISGRNMEIQRFIGRSLRSVVDTKKIGERTIRIDCDVIQADGGTRVSSIVGGFVALTDCLCKLYKKAEISEVCITDFLGAISVGILEGGCILDLAFDEDSKAKVDMNIVMNSGGKIVEIQGTAEHGSFSQEELNAMLELGNKGIEQIIDIERKLFGDILLK